jgi:hypothetical protein
LFHGFLISLAALMSGCATNKMAFEGDEERIVRAHWRRRHQDGDR